MSISGIASGIEWDKMVEELLEQARKPAYVMVDKRDRLERKKTSYEEFLVSLRNLQSTLTPLKLAATYKAKAVEISRVDSNGSYKSVLNATVNSDAEINVHDLQVLQLAGSQVKRSNQIGGVALSTLGSITASNSHFYVSAGGQNVRIDADPAGTLFDLADKINTTLKTQNPPVQVTASVVDGRLYLKSDSTGLGTTEVTQELTRAVSGTDTLNFNVNPSNGKATVKIGSTTYTMGKDFDVVNGNKVRWRTLDPLVPHPGAVYQDEYVAYGGDTFKMSVIRSSSGDVDKGALPFTPFDASDGAAITITSAGLTYVRGTDFDISADGSIHWLKAYRQPAAGASYEVTYTAGGGEKITLDITRESRDTVVLGAGLTFADLAPGGAVVRLPGGGRLLREGFDFDVVQGKNGEPVIQWYAGGAGDFPEPGVTYTVDFKKTDGTTLPPASVTSSSKDTISLPAGGTFTTAPQGTHTITYNGTPMGTNMSGSFTPNLLTSSGTSGIPGTTLEITWNPPGGTPITHSPAAPKSGDPYTLTYSYDTNIFSLSDDGNGFLAALGLDLTDDEHYTAAQDAVMMLDGERVVRSSNNIGASHDNELIKGMTIELKGLGHVNLDVSQDAEQAVKGLQSFVEQYNAVIEWINTRLTEKELDESKKATVDSDDFRMRWGLLNGSSLLRDSKNTLRRLTSQTYITPSASKTSRNTIYGTMGQNGIMNAASFSISVPGASVNIPVDPSDTLQTIRDKINANTLDGQPNPFRFDADGKALPVPLAQASVSGGKLTITGHATNGPATLGGSSHVLRTLQIDQQYTALSQIGIKMPSTGQMSDITTSGVLEFDTSVFMTALETNAEDVASMATAFANQMQTYMDDMVKTSQKQFSTGVVAAQGAVAREMNAIDTEIASIDKYLKDFQRRLDDKQQALQRQFSAAEVNLSKLIQQADWLSSVTSQLQQSAASR
jgi:flagellar capping protein FliD